MSLATAAWQFRTVHTRDDMLACIAAVLDALRTHGFDDKEMHGTRLSLEEAIVNSMRHGHRGDTSKRVEVRFHVDGPQLLVEIEDQGRGFDPDGLPDPLAPRNLERPGGRGVYLMRQYMSWVQYNEDGNCVTLCKIRNSSLAKGGS